MARDEIGANVTRLIPTLRGSLFGNNLMCTQTIIRLEMTNQSCAVGPCRGRVEVAQRASSAPRNDVRGRS